MITLGCLFFRFRKAHVVKYTQVYLCKCREVENLADLTCCSSQDHEKEKISQALYNLLGFVALLKHKIDLPIPFKKYRYYKKNIYV